MIEFASYSKVYQNIFLSINTLPITLPTALWLLGSKSSAVALSFAILGAVWVIFMLFEVMLERTEKGFNDSTHGILAWCEVVGGLNSDSRKSYYRLDVHAKNLINEHYLHVLQNIKKTNISTRSLDDISKTVIKELGLTIGFLLRNKNNEYLQEDLKSIKSLNEILKERNSGNHSL